MPVEAVIFDIGGVLELNPRTGWQDRWASRLGLDRRSLDARLGETWRAGSVGGLTLAEIESRTGDELGLDAETVTLLMDDVWAEYLGSLNQELASYFAALRSRCKTGILSNSFVGAREREQALYGFEDICDVLVYSHEIGYLKPDPRAYEAVCDQLEVAPGRALFLDDLKANVHGALAAGLHAVTFVDNDQAIAALERHLNSIA